MNCLRELEERAREKGEELRQKAPSLGTGKLHSKATEQGPFA